MTEEENKEYTGIMTDIDVYREEMLFKFITGQEPIEKLDQYFVQLKNMILNGRFKFSKKLIIVIKNVQTNWNNNY